MAFNPFSTGADEANRIRMRNSRRGAAMLTPEAIGNTARGLMEQRGNELRGVAEAGAVAGAIDSAKIAQNFALQGLAGSGLGAGIAGGMRSGTTFKTNQLVSALNSEMYNMALQANTSAGNMIANTFIEAEPSAFGSALQATGGMLLGVGALGNLR